MCSMQSSTRKLEHTLKFADLISLQFPRLGVNLWGARIINPLIMLVKRDTRGKYADGYESARSFLPAQNVSLFLKRWG